MAKEKIIETAVRLFSQKGYDGVSMEEIAKAVGVTKAAIYYHFADKQALYNATFSLYLKPLSQAIGMLDDDVDSIENYIDTFARTFEQHPTFAKLFLQEFAQDGIHLDELNIGYFRSIFTKLRSILKDSSIDPVQLQLMIVPPLLMYHTTKIIRHKITQSEYLHFVQAIKNEISHLLKGKG